MANTEGMLPVLVVSCFSLTQLKHHQPEEIGDGWENKKKPGWKILRDILLAYGLVIDFIPFTLATCINSFEHCDGSTGKEFLCPFLRTQFRKFQGVIYQHDANILKILQNIHRCISTT